jgi:hypothetical protein
VALSGTVVYLFLISCDLHFFPIIFHKHNST